jgi:hypothetical protein
MTIVSLVKATKAIDQKQNPVFKLQKKKKKKKKTKPNSIPKQQK